MITIYLNASMIIRH